jgi:tetratricopeptide (TPR) repeat protein
MDSSATQNIFVRNDQGTVWGPLSLSTIQMLVDNRLIKGKLQLSQDGVNFGDPGRFPALRGAFPRELWGDVPPEGNPNQAPRTAPAASAIPIAGPGSRVNSARPVAAPPKPAPRLNPAAPVAPVVEPARPVLRSPEAPLASTPPASGDLAVHTPFRLYYLAASSERSGLLTLQLADRQIEIHFRKGNPEYVGSSHPEDSLAAFLRAKGMATAEQLAKAEAAIGNFGGELIGALFGLGILNPGTVFASLAQRAALLLTQGLQAERGTFTYQLKELPGAKAMPLGHRWALLAEQVRKLSASELRRRLGPKLDAPVMKSGGRVNASELRLSAQESRALSHFDGVRSLEQLIRDLPQEAEALTRAVFLLHQVEILAFAEVTARPAPAPGRSSDPVPPPPAAPQPGPAAIPARPVPPRPVAVARPPAPAASKPAAAPVSVEEELKQLTALLQQMKTQSHFEVLGIPNTADASAVKMAYFRMAKLYHPDTGAQGAPESIGKLKEQVFGRIGDAYRTLGDDKSRAEYLENLKAGVTDQDRLDIAQIFAAEEHFKRACILVRGRKFAEAIKLLDQAIAGNSKEGEFYAWRGYARFFTISDPTKGQTEALKDLQLCLQKNERCAQAYYFIGQIAKLCGNAPDALRNFQKCLQLQSDHLDAQREIRLAQKK